MTSIFVSHSHSDQRLAEQLVEYLLSSLSVAPKDVRCTSVPGHQLAFGSTIAEQLKADIHSSSAVLILLTEQALQSKWVMFELGASWALGKVVVPILGSGVGPEMLPGPLAAYPSVAVASPDARSRMADAIAQIASQLSLNEITGGKRESALQRFMQVALEKQVAALETSEAMGMAFEIPWLVLLIVSGQARHPTALFPQIKHYVKQLGLELSQPIETSIRMDDEGKSAMDLIAALGGSVAVQHPNLTAVYEAGANLFPLAARGQARELEAAVARLPIPDDLKVPREDRLVWLNEIHEYFSRGLRKRAL